MGRELIARKALRRVLSALSLLLLLVVSAHGQTPPTVGCTSNAQGSASSASVTAPSCVSKGDLLLAFAKVDNNGTISLSGSWNVQTDQNSQTGEHLFSLYRTASSEPSSYTLTNGTSGAYAVHVYDIPNGNIESSSSGSAASGTTFNGPAYTTTHVWDLVFSAAAEAGNGEPIPQNPVANTGLWLNMGYRDDRGLSSGYVWQGPSGGTVAGVPWKSQSSVNAVWYGQQVAVYPTSAPSGSVNRFLPLRNTSPGVGEQNSTTTAIQIDPIVQNGDVIL